MTSQAAKNITVAILAAVLTALAIIVAVPVVRIVYRIDSFLTTDRLKNLENNIDTSSMTAQMTANAYKQVADSTTDAIDRHVSPGIDRMVNRFDSAMLKVERRVEALAPLQSELTATAAEVRAQIKQNGDAATRTINALTTFTSDTTTRVNKLLEDGTGFA